MFSYVQDKWDWLGQSRTGRALQRGIGDSFGWSFGKNVQGNIVSEGVFGWRSVARENFANTLEGTARAKTMGPLPQAQYQSIEKRAAQLRNTSGGAKVSWLTKGSPVSTVGRLAGKGMGLAFTGFLAYQGYQEGGVLGAAGGVAESVRDTWMLHMLGVSAPMMVAGAAVAGLGFAGYAVGEHAKAHAKKMRSLEMGANVVDPFGTAGTLRQRSLQALQNSRINGRMGLGNEALIMHRSF